MYAQTDVGGAFGSVRRPIQCEGITRGPERMAEIGVSGSVNPQINWGNVLGTVAKVAGPLLTSLI